MLTGRAYACSVWSRPPGTAAIAFRSNDATISPPWTTTPNDWARRCAGIGPLKIHYTGSSMSSSTKISPAHGPENIVIRHIRSIYCKTKHQSRHAQGRVGPQIFGAYWHMDSFAIALGTVLYDVEISMISPLFVRFSGKAVWRRNAALGIFVAILAPIQLLCL